jgi:hypothetical protein
VILTAAGFGVQRLSNLVELFFLAVASVVPVYVEDFALDGRFTFPPRSTYVVVILLDVLALALRTFMPVLPE